MLQAPNLFDSCLNLSSITLMQSLLEPGQLTSVSPGREIPQGCFGSSGLSDLKLPPEFHLLGPHGCDNGKLLAFVDLSSTPITEIREFTFSHCIRLQHIWLPKTLQTIHVKTFMDCAILREIEVPPTLRYIASKAFLDCTLLTNLTLMPGKRTTWRGPYAEQSAFEFCYRFTMPAWINLLPNPGYDPT